MASVPSRISRRRFFVTLSSVAAGTTAARAGLLSGKESSSGGRMKALEYHNLSKNPAFAALPKTELRGPKEQGKRISLADEPEKLGGNMTAGAAIHARRSIRSFSAETLSLAGLSHLCHCAAGITSSRGGGLRAAPSAGATYPMETYVAVSRVGSLEPGMYRYLSREHVLELMREGSPGKAIAACCLGQRFVGKANVAFILTAVFQRCAGRYGERAYRYIHLEAGHIAENLYLAATALGLGACAVGAFSDDMLNRQLGLDGVKEAAIYVVAVGKR